MPSPWIYLLDVVLCAIVLRIILGWLLAYPRLIRLMASLVIVVSFGVLIYFLELQLAGILVLLFLVPVVVILFLSFLPELSRVYQAASRGNLFRPRIFQGEEILSDLAEALIQFKQRHLGCLLVFPGNRDEEGLVSGGEEVDALVNRSLLLSIFDPHCPRHDGAAIIRGNRIVRIGAVLPLASAEGADAHLGTRHLAAIGLSERIDGYVLVVSEERGVLSYAHDGKLKEIKYSDKEELKQILSRILGGEEQEEESVRQQKVLPALLWIMAIILAGFGSWQVKQIKEQFREQYTETRTVYFQEVDATIQYTLDPERQFVADWKTTPVRLVLRVPEAIQIKNEPAILIDLKDQPFGKTRIEFTSLMVSGLPQGAAVQSFAPRNIDFNLAEVKRLEVDVTNPKIIDLAEDLEVTERKLNLEKVSTVIRERYWKSSRKLESLPVSLAEIREPGDYVLPVKLNLPATVELEEGMELTIQVKIESKQTNP